jgi:oxalate decarboxylase
MLAATAAGGLLTATTLAQTQTQNGEAIPETGRPGRGGTNPGPKNPARARQNPDLLSPPATDHGTLPNLRFSFDDSHVRLESGGWTRQVTARELGISKNIAGVSGPTCSTVRRASRRSIRKGGTLLTMSA